MIKLNFRLAEFSDIPTLVELINQSYREQQGRSWTTEVEYVKGQRINKEQLKQQLELPNSVLLIGEIDSSKVVTCIGLTFQSNTVEIGTFCTDPHVQNMKIGRSVLEYAEQFALHKVPELDSAIMYILNVRSELIAYYERSGYIKTGNHEPYPLDANVGLPLIPIKLIEMKKDLK
ncbi:GNAT family N-acetyltransferase [Acinetobacter baumannii]|uniref:GNAT family N-acetyltransferase n=1 Tax=Acinetobacter baumannii TaxID=470 RepID=UPI0026F73772|nr:GNAT family N-acetyltransferase [Acinetobacter baumannii]MDO7295405.1 GNAT family N-acetyltransferase [Acinetobacter baumannii]MDW5372678.1 GNAT family N-acetyltransferase [Acinetobacter baumannii]MDW5438518.1 GNAT family N-acetyltransferase [Acinetobacter baumannii]HDU8164134.1 GNAT family N-acetyltransferase [Acinetobacter baumannii]